MAGIAVEVWLRQDSRTGPRNRSEHREIRIRVSLHREFNGVHGGRAELRELKLRVALRRRDLGSARRGAMMSHVESQAAGLDSGMPVKRCIVVSGGMEAWSEGETMESRWRDLGNPSTCHGEWKPNGSPLSISGALLVQIPAPARKLATRLPGPSATIDGRGGAGPFLRVTVWRVPRAESRCWLFSRRHVVSERHLAVRPVAIALPS